MVLSRNSVRKGKNQTHTCLGGGTLLCDHGLEHATRELLYAGLKRLQKKKTQHPTLSPAAKAPPSPLPPPAAPVFLSAAAAPFFFFFFFLPAAPSPPSPATAPAAATATSAPASPPPAAAAAEPFAAVAGSSGATVGDIIGIGRVRRLGKKNTRHGKRDKKKSTPLT